MFDRSIASLQFFVEKELPVLFQRLFMHGATGIIDAIPALEVGIADELERLNEQDALDTVDAFEQNAVECFDSIRRLESLHTRIEAAMNGWAIDALGFIRDARVDSSEKIFRYRLDAGLDGKLRSLVPRYWISRFDQHFAKSGTFDREAALLRPGTSIFRIGEGFVDEMSRYLDWDDRGKAFAFWRHEPGWNRNGGVEWIGFRFNYVVSTDLRSARTILEERGFQASAIRALNRRADAHLPPLVEVVYVDTDGWPQRIPGCWQFLNGRTVRTTMEGQTTICKTKVLQ